MCAVTCAVSNRNDIVFIQEAAQRDRPKPTSVDHRERGTMLYTSYSLSAVPGCTQLYQDPAPLWTIEMCPEIRTNCVSGLSPLDFAAFGQSTPKELFRLKMSLQEAKRLWSTILYQLQHLTPMVSIASGHGRRD